MTDIIQLRIEANLRDKLRWCSLQGLGGSTKNKFGVKTYPTNLLNLMKKRLIKISAVALTAVFIIFAVTNWWVYRSDRVTKAFVGHLSHERYGEAALMLITPSYIEVDSKGGVVLVDQSGNRTAVPKTRLPFLAGGGRSDGPGEFSMTALQGSQNGRVEGAVTVYLSVDGGKIRIERVDSF